MTAAHQHPVYLRNSRILRKQINAMHKGGRPVWCVRCGREIQPGQRFDIGHRIDASRGGSHSPSNLGPEHRGENRAAGGRLGAAKTNDIRGVSRKARGLPTW